MYSVPSVAPFDLKDSASGVFRAQDRLVKQSVSAVRLVERCGPSGRTFVTSARLLPKHPGFTLTAIGVLTLGIGVNAGIFGIINGMMIRPLAGADAPGEVVGLFSKDRTTERGYRAFSYPGFVDVRDAGGPFAALAAHNVALGGVTENNTTRQALVDIISTGYFETLGVRPDLRPRLHDRRRASGHAVAPGHHQLQALGTFRLRSRHPQADRPHQRPGLRHRRRRAGTASRGTTAIIGTEYFLPLGVHDAIESDFDATRGFRMSDRRSQPLIVVGRLKPGVTRDAG